MKIEFEDEETAVVSVEASVVDNESGVCVEDGHLVYTFDLAITDDERTCPTIVGMEKGFAFPANANRPYSLSFVALGMDDKYRIDSNEERFSAMAQKVEEEWWNKYAENHFEYTYGTFEEPAHWRSK